MPGPRDDITAARNRDWFSDPTRLATCTNCGTDIRAIARTFFNIGWDYGCRWAIRRTTQSSSQIGDLVALLTWLFGSDDDKQRSASEALYNAARDVCFDWHKLRMHTTAKIAALGVAVRNYEIAYDTALVATATDEDPEDFDYDKQSY